MSLSGLTSFFATTDEQTMWRVQMHDDAEAFGRLVAKWQGPIRGLCARMLGDAHRGEDLTQEAFARLYAKRKEYQPSAKFSTFLWRVALNLCYDELRRQKRRPESPLETCGADGEERLSILDRELPAAPGPDAEMVRREEADVVREALRRLPEHYRAVVVLRHYEDLKFREIAEVLGIPEGTVKSRMAEGLDQLQEILRRALRAEECSAPARRPAPRESLML